MTTVDLYFSLVFGRGGGGLSQSCSNFHECLGAATAPYVEELVAHVWAHAGLPMEYALHLGHIWYL